MKNKINKKDYQKLADCIRSDQVPCSVVAHHFNNKNFYNWYKKKYLKFYNESK